MAGRLAAAAMVAAGMLACSKPKPPAPYGETDEYREWKGSLFVYSQLRGAFGTEQLQGSIDFDLGTRECTPDDWIEVAYNGDVLGRKFIHNPPGQPRRILRTDLKVRTGPNWISFFDTATNRAFKFQVDTRTADPARSDFAQAAHFLFKPGGPEGFSVEQRGR